MAWGLEARVPFLDKKFLEVAMNIDAEHKMFSKGADQETDEDGRPKMEKVSCSRSLCLRQNQSLSLVHHPKSLRLFTRRKGLLA